MAYADFITGNGAFSNLFASAEERKSKRERKAEYKRKRCEIDRMSEKELMDLGYCRRDMHEMVYRHYFTG
ncbi:hypothetical protein [Ruegeria sp. Ofav3-42]|uniref:hypothetical protein n=1 Tax=Ruegeria sp. Ofav3-42 TaxID=2917759 RepID=UPI001EF70C33|nr:hypothetical protein [Ruegeria sp. Ofav3-42]MCG7520921.1 hypothetical protein [Ruegeria sp. Ofav3-42]